MQDLTIALGEEIGNPDLFSGRKREMAFYLNWADKTKDLLSKSQALLSRRKKGKTSIVQRLFNILWSKNDPRVVPFFFRVPEIPMSTVSFGHLFYRTFLSQYISFLNRNTYLVDTPHSLDELLELAGSNELLIRDIRRMHDVMKTDPALVWNHAQSAPHRLARALDIRFIQIIDEFQYMNRFLFTDEALTRPVDLCHSYMGLAESKYAPLFVTGSYIGWLSTILSHMTARFEDRELDYLPDDEAVEMAYNYAGIFGQPVTDDTARYIAEVAHNDPFYISQVVRTNQPDLDLTTREGVRAAMQFETTVGKGYVAKIWMEYITEGIARINDVNGRKIVLYLARHGEEERSRDQIKQDMNIDATDNQLAERLHQLYKADLIGEGSSALHYKGLGDPIFEAIFRKRFGPEIERVASEKITEDFERQLKEARGKEAFHKGRAGEYRVMYFLLLASSRGLEPAQVIENPTPGFKLAGFVSMKKKTWHGDQDRKIEVDFHAVSKSPDGLDLIAEVKTWDKPVGKDEVAKFIANKESLRLERKTAFLFYSENGFTEPAEQLMGKHRVMYTTYHKIAGPLALI